MDPTAIASMFGPQQTGLAAAMGNMAGVGQGAGMGPMAQAGMGMSTPVATPSFMPGGMPLTDAHLTKLANAPIDPAKILQLLSQNRQQGAPNAPAPAGARGPGEVEQARGAQLQGNRQGLAAFLGR